jgi:hypothetical protein
VRIIVVSESLSKVSRRRSNVSGRPSKFVRKRLRAMDCCCCDGNRACDIAGDVDMCSSSPSGDAFRFREDVGVPADTSVAMSVVANEVVGKGLYCSWAEG